MKFLTYPEKIGIGYFSIEPSTYIGFLKKDVYFDKNGYFDPSCITWEGIMSRPRIGDILPYEYDNN